MGNMYKANLVGTVTGTPVVETIRYEICGYHDDGGTIVIEEFNTLAEAQEFGKTNWLHLYYSGIWMNVVEQVTTRIAL